MRMLSPGAPPAGGVSSAHAQARSPACGGGGGALCACPTAGALPAGCAPSARLLQSESQGHRGSGLCLVPVRTEREPTVALCLSTLSRIR